MPSDGTQLPLVLRRELFGGLLFDPTEATSLELDPDGYAFVRDWLAGKRAPASDEERAFVAQVQAEAPWVAPRSRAVRLRDEPPALAPMRNATVLAAPTLVDVQVTRRCRMACPHCYVSAGPAGEHLPFADAVHLLDEVAEAGVCQVAIGGGEPLLHPDIVPIIERAHALGVIVNLTTTGDGLTPLVLETLARCSGAVALSLEGVGPEFAVRRRAGFDFFEASREQLRAYGIRTAFHVTLSLENLPSLPAIVDYCLGCPDLLGVIFLAYKPVGRGQGYDTPLGKLEAAQLHPPLRDAIARLAAHTRVGYDCCLTPGIAGIEAALGLDERDRLEGCSAARTSVGVTTDMEVVPCTFLTHVPLGNLRRQSLRDIWRGPAAAVFRRRLDALVDGQEACRACPARGGCLGGCPEWDLVRCPRRAS